MKKPSIFKKKGVATSPNGQNGTAPPAPLPKKAKQKEKKPKVSLYDRLNPKYFRPFIKWNLYILGFAIVAFALMLFSEAEMLNELFPVKGKEGIPTPEDQVGNNYEDKVTTLSHIFFLLHQWFTGFLKPMTAHFFRSIAWTAYFYVGFIYVTSLFRYFTRVRPKHIGIKTLLFFISVFVILEYHFWITRYLQYFL